MAIGIQETLEVVQALNEVALVLARNFKDGVQVGDAVSIVTQLLSDDEFKAKLSKAFENVSKVPAEIAEFGLDDAAVLFTEEIAFVPKLIAAFKA
jgi:antitoxin component HigA of HigAB toxin-antitoxin module